MVRKKNTSNGYDDEENPVLNIINNHQLHTQSYIIYIYIHTTYEPVLSGGLTLGFATFCFPFLALELLLVDVKPW